MLILSFSWFTLFLVPIFISMETSIDFALDLTVNAHPIARKTRVHNVGEVRVWFVLGSDRELQGAVQGCVQGSVQAPYKEQY